MVVVQQSTGSSRLPLLPPDRRARRLTQLYAGLILYGASMAMQIRAGLGLDPWDVFHQGLTERLDWSFGTVTIVVGALVLLLWIPLRQWPGIGTLSNVVVIGLAVDATLAVLDAPDSLLGQVVAPGRRHRAERCGRRLLHRRRARARPARWPDDRPGAPDRRLRASRSGPASKRSYCWSAGRWAARSASAPCCTRSRSARSSISSSLG